MRRKKIVLLLTDFSYQAKGREYFREDVELSSYLRKYFNVCISHIKDIDKVIHHVDLVLIRNTGPQIFHQKELMDLKNAPNLIIFNDLSGKGDIKGKHHLLELFQLGFPVIPTFNSIKDVEEFGSYNNYLLKPIDGADSNGVKIVSNAELKNEKCENVLIQPLVEFEYEVSFYFINKQFYYSLYTPDPKKRWELKLYEASDAEQEFALNFINWNTCKFGIQRVDACKLKDGTLLLMELEDYNPFLSLDLLPKDLKEFFLEGLCSCLSNRVI